MTSTYAGVMSFGGATSVLRSVSHPTSLVVSTTYPLTITMVQQQTLTQAIKEDHREVCVQLNSGHYQLELTSAFQMKEYYVEYLRATGDVDAQARWSRQFTWEVARHSVGEEIVVYPLLEKHLGERGRKLADHDRNDHQVFYPHWEYRNI